MSSAGRKVSARGRVSARGWLSARGRSSAGKKVVVRVGSSWWSRFECGEHVGADGHRVCTHNILVLYQSCLHCFTSHFVVQLTGW